MAKPLKFKDFLTVNNTPGMPDEVALNSKKRKRDMSTSEEAQTEALTTPERLKRARLMKRYKSRIAIGREKAKKRTASMAVIKRRAQKQARSLVAKKLAQGIDKSELTNQRKAEIEKRLDTPAAKARIERLVKKMIPRVRKAEMERKRGIKPTTPKPAV